jgi:hypothetical protein
MKESIWVRLSSGFDCVKKKFWYEIIPSVAALKAVSLGRTRKSLFGKTEYLVLFRDDTCKSSPCVISWIRESELCERQ